MKIKFIKDYRFIGNDPDDGSDTTVKAGSVIDLENEESTKWLIDNGFAEEVEESSGWKPKYNEEYFYVGHDGSVHPCLWANDPLDNARLKLGSVFKTEEATERYRDYMEAVETVSHDEGFMKISRKINYSPCGYGVYRGFGKSIIAEVSDMTVYAGEFYFDTYENAKASVEVHESEWQTILNYDWSRE